jgi:carbon-monoxide dehydrogenase large subunit
MDYFLPTAVETPHWETDYTVTPSPHHPIGAKGVGESPNVGSVPCFANAVNDAFKFLGSTHIQMPHDAYRTWQAAENSGCTVNPSPARAFARTSRLTGYAGEGRRRNAG